MTVDVQDVPTQAESGKRRLKGMGVGVGVLVLVAVPVSLSAFVAVMGFSTGAPLMGAVFVGFVLLLLALPVVAGLLAARVLTASGWKIGLTIAAQRGLRRRSGLSAYCWGKPGRTFGSVTLWRHRATLGPKGL